MTSLEAEQNRDEWLRVNSEEKHYKRINEQVQMFSILEQTQKYDNKPMNNSTPIANIIQINPLKWQANDADPFENFRPGWDWTCQVLGWTFWIRRCPSKQGDYFSYETYRGDWDNRKLLCESTNILDAKRTVQNYIRDLWPIYIDTHMGDQLEFLG